MAREGSDPQGRSIKRIFLVLSLVHLISVILVFVLSGMVDHFLPLLAAVLLTAFCWGILWILWRRFEGQLQFLVGRLSGIGVNQGEGSNGASSVTGSGTAGSEKLGEACWRELTQLKGAEAHVLEFLADQNARYKKARLSLQRRLQEDDEKLESALRDLAAGGLERDGLQAEAEELHERLTELDGYAGSSADHLLGVEAVIEGMVSAPNQRVLLQKWEEVSGLVERLVESLEITTGGMRDGSSRGSDGLELTQQGLAAVEQLSGEMDTIRERIQQSSASVEEMQRHSEEIERIVHTIDDIADQTNLLALNAAIEAARAEAQSLLIGETLLKNHLLGTASLLAEMLVAKQGSVSNEDMKMLAERARVENISYSNEDGVLVASNTPESDLGFRYPDDPTDFWYPLRALIHEKEGEATFPIMPRDSDGQLFMYVAVSRRDCPGAVQAAASGESVTNFAQNTRGFSVVAGEVRKLAEETLEATREVRQQIRTVQDSVKQGAEAMELSSNAVESGAGQAVVVREHFQKIMLSVEAIGEILSGLNNETGGAADAAAEIQAFCRDFAESLDEDEANTVKVNEGLQSVSVLLKEMQKDLEGITRG